MQRTRSSPKASRGVDPDCDRSGAREQRVQQLAELVAAGQYHVRTEAVADKIMDSMLAKGRSTTGKRAPRRHA